MTPTFFHLTQPAAALAKDVYLHTGWRPAMALGFSGEIGFWAKFDGEEDSSDDAWTMPDGASGAGTIVEDAADVCRIMDSGLKLGSSASWIRGNSMKIRIMVFPPGDAGPYKAVLNRNTAKASTVNSGKTIGTFAKAFGTGKQFGATPQDGSQLQWIEIEA